MKKREKKIEAIRRYIENVGGTTWPGYPYGKIPSNIATNACYAYAGAVQPKDILGLVDITVMGNGKKGLLFTEYEVYYDNGMVAENGRVTYQEIYDSGKIPGSISGPAYNKQALIELLSILADIEGENIQDTINGTMDNLNEGLQSATQTVEKAMDLMDSILSLFGK